MTKLVWCLGILAAVGCGGRPSVEPKASGGGETAPKVSVVQPQRKSLQRVVEQPGTIQPYEETHLFARVPGYVAKVHADIGQKVLGPKNNPSSQIKEPGQTLAEIDVPEMHAEAKQKQALVKQTEAEVDQAEKSLDAAKANIGTLAAAVVEAKANRDRWDSESKRIDGLVKRGLMDAQAGDETMNQYRATAARVLFAEAAVRKAQADADKAEADVRAAKTRVKVAQADAARQEAMLAFAQIHAPFDGVVTLRKVNTGDLVSPTGGKGEWLFTVARLNPVRVVVEVPEADAGLVQDKAEVQLRIQALRGPELKGVIARTSWALQPGARTLRAEIDLLNPDGLLRPGMYVYARIINHCPEAWTVPATALVKQDDTMVCYFIEAGKAVRTPVQVGRSDGQATEVLKHQKPGAPGVWQEFTGKETLAGKAAGLTDGKVIE